MLYGLGVTIGAGIYVLIGVAVEQAGMFAPSAFLLAAVVMAFSACSFAELSGRLPQAAGEAVYVEAAFGLRWLTLATGFCIVLSAIVAAAAITLGGTGYILTLIELPQPVVVAAVIVGELLGHPFELHQRLACAQAHAHKQQLKASEERATARVQQLERDLMACVSHEGDERRSNTGSQ